MLIDPCYVDDWVPEDTNQPHTDLWDEENPYSYAKACQLTCDPTNKEDRYGGEMKSPGGYGGAWAVVCSTGYGDGRYPVYIEKEDGRVKSMTIEFFGGEEEEEDYDDEDDDYDDEE